MDCNLPGSSVHGILQARILEWVPCLPPGDLPDPGIEPVSLMSPGLAGGFFTINVSYYLKLARYMPQINLPIYKSSNVLYVCRWKITALRILVSSSQCPCIFLVKQSVKSLNQKKMSNPLNSYKKRGERNILRTKWIGVRENDLLQRKGSLYSVWQRRRSGLCWRENCIKLIGGREPGSPESVARILIWFPFNALSEFD